METAPPQIDIAALIGRLPWKGTSPDKRQQLAELVAELCTSGAPITPEPKPLNPLALYVIPEHVPPVIATTGYPRHGKDVGSDYMELLYVGVKRLAFSDVMVLEANAWLASEPLVSHHRIHIGNKSHLPYRQLLQLSAMLRREEYAQYWTDKLKVVVKAMSAEPWTRFVSMAGARDEVDLALVKELGGEYGRVYRPYCPDPLPESPIERALDHLRREDYDFVLDNDREGNFAHYLRQIENRWGIGDQYANPLSRATARLLGMISYKATWGSERRVRLGVHLLKQLGER